MTTLINVREKVGGPGLPVSDLVLYLETSLFVGVGLVSTGRGTVVILR